MLFLVLAVVFGSLFSVIFKICQRIGVDTRQVILFNYVTAVLFSWVPVLVKVVTDEGTLLLDYTLPVGTCLLAVLQGVLFTLGFIVMDRCTWRSGVALTTASARASLVLPVILSWVILNQPAPAWVPVALVLVSMLLIVLPAENEKHDPAKLTNKTDEQRRKLTILALCTVFFVYGISDFSLKLLQHSVEVKYSPDETAVSNHLTSQMGVIFLVASLCSLALCIVSGSFKKHRLSWKSIGSGTLLGLVNTGCTACVLRALGAMSTGLFYPLYNIGIVIVATLVGVLFFKERIKWLQLAGLALAVTAIALLF